MDDSEVEYFLQFHHSLGDFIYCPPSEGERCIITNPQWLVDRFEELVSTLLSPKLNVDRTILPNERGQRRLSQMNIFIVFGEDMTLNFS